MKNQDQTAFGKDSFNDCNNSRGDGQTRFRIGWRKGMILGAAVLLTLSFVAVKHLQEDTTVASADQPAADEPGGLRADYGRVPLSFEANQGQTAAEVQFLSRGSGYTLFLAPTKAVLSLQPRTNDSHKKPVTNVLSMELKGANPAAEVEGRDLLPGKSNYFVGNDPKNWRTNVDTFAKVNYQAVYEGVDLVYYGNQRQLEYDFIVAPNADASQIRWAVPTVAKAELDEAGGLVMHVNGSDVQMKKPVVYQTIKGERVEIAASYSIQSPRSKIDDQEVSFTLGSYDHAEPLVIDPVIIFSSSLLDGSGADTATAIAVDSSGNAYVTGNTASTNFPTVNPIQATLSGQDAFISKYNAAGTALIYSTYLGGSSVENGWDIAVDAAGNAYVAGRTTSLDFPVTAATAFQPTKTTNNTVDAGFVTRLNANGTLGYSTYLYSNQGTSVFGIGTDGAGNAYVTGRSGTGFPTTANAFQTLNFNSGFFTKLNTNASGAASLVYSTYLGPTGFGEGHAIAVDATGNAYVTGNVGSTSTNFTSPGAFQTTFGGGTADAFVIKFNTNLSGAASRVYSTYLGGNANDFGGQSTPSGSKAIAIDTAGNAYITGFTTSTNFPTANAFQASNAGATDAFLAKLNPAGSALVYSTYLGGSGGSSDDEGRSVAVNVAGNAYVVGLTASSTNFPTASPLATADGTTGGAFLAKFAPGGNTLVYSTRFGATLLQGLGLALDGAGNAFTTSAQGSGTTVNEIADPTVIGRVVDEDGNPISGAIASLTGVPSGPTLTDSNGFYTFGLLTSANNYTVGVTVPNYIFVSQPVNNLVKNIRLDFNPVVFSLSGQIVRCGSAQSGVAFALTDGKSLTATSDGSGNYSYANLPAGRNYTVTPSLAGFTFTPASRTVTSQGANQTASFVVTPPPFATVAGKVLTSDNRGVRNAIVAITNSQGVTITATTSSFGFYSFDNMPTGETYTVRIASRLFRFATQTKQVDCNQTLPDFVGLE